MFFPDYEIKKQIMDLHMAEKVHYCYQCGRCTDVCPVSQLEPERYDPRQNVMMGLLGLTHMILTPDKQFNLWGCQTCDLCDEICPNDIVLTDIFNILKNASIKMGIAPEAYQSQAKMVMEFGKSVPLQDAIARRRDKMGLPVLPEPDLAEIQKILRITKFDKKIGYEEPKEEKK
jgi:heterodisulfide reductase subunit C